MADASVLFVRQVHGNLPGKLREFSVQHLARFGEDDVAVFALEKAGKLGQVKVIGFDAMPQGRQAIKAGKIWGDPIQFPDKIGRHTIEAVFKHLNGEIVPKVILFPTSFYTKTDADKDPSLK